MDTDTDVEVNLSVQSDGDDYCNSALYQWMHGDRGPSLLFGANIPCHVLADLMTNRRLKKLVLSRECLEENLACKVVAQAANLGFGETVRFWSTNALPSIGIFGTFSGIAPSLEVLV
jgi:hypothetical protein